MADRLLGTSARSARVFRTVHGVETVPVVSDGSEKQTVYGAVVGEPYRTRVVTAAVDLVEYGRPATIEAAPRAEVVRLAAVPGG